MFNKTLSCFIAMILMSSVFAKIQNWSTLPKIKSTKETSRRPTASADNLSPTYIKLRDEYLKIKDPLALHKFMVKLNNNYNSYPDDVKLFIAVMSPTMAARSIVYRGYDLADQHKLFRATMVTMLMRLATGIELLEPGAQSKTTFRYATEPFLPGDNNLKFKKESDVQDYMMEEVRPLIEVAIERIKQIDMSSDKIVLDLQLFNGAASFQDGIARYRYVGKPEKDSILSTLYANLAAIYQFNAYSIDSLIEFNLEISKKFGFEGLRILTNVQGLNTQQLVDIFKKSTYKNLFKLRSNGVQDMKKSYAYMRESAIHAHYSYNDMKERNLDEDDILRFDLVGPFRNALDMTDANLIALYSSGEPKTNKDGSVSIQESEAPTIRSEVTGQTVKVNMAGYFNNPPKDLKDLLPTRFETGDKYVTIRVKKNKNDRGQSYKYRNYRRGMPIGWNNDQFKYLFPELRSDQKVSDAVAVIGQSFSTGVVFMPMVFAINP